jgi:putative ABC transport system substrate-binding protein
MILVRIALAFTVGLGVLAAPLITAAQPTGKVPRIGFLSPRSAGPDFRTDAFRHSLRDLGYVEGSTVLIEYRYAEGKPERLPQLAAELVRLKPDVIVTSSAPAIRAAKNATSDIPIVMASTGDPIAAGFVASLARPGGNITGLSLLALGIGGKRLELLKEALPALKRVGVLRKADNPFHQEMFKEMERSAAMLGLRIDAVDIRDAGALTDSRFSALVKDGVGALIQLEDPFWAASRKPLVDLTMRHRLPTMFIEQDFVRAGGLMSYGVNAADLYRRAAVYVDKILKGVRPADLPVEQPVTFDLAINRRTAKALGLTIPPALLLRADHVID